MSLTSEQISFFNENGYVIAPGILTDQDFAPLEAEVQAWISEKARDLFERAEIEDLCEDAPFDTRIAKLYGQCPKIVGGLDIMHRRGPATFAFLHNANLLDAVESLVGSEIACSPIQHLRAKMPSNLGDGKHELVPWHQDAGVTLEEADPSNIVTCWIPLIDANCEVGCMEIIPRAHTRGHMDHVTGTTIHPEQLPDTPPIAAECPRGGVIFMSKYTPHRGLPNRSDKARWTIDLRYQPTGTPSGRPFHPSFVVRSKARPESTRPDYETWCRRWIEGLAVGKGKQIHRVVELVGG